MYHTPKRGQKQLDHLHYVSREYEKLAVKATVDLDLCKANLDATQVELEEVKARMSACEQAVIEATSEEARCVKQVAHYKDLIHNFEGRT